MRREFSRESKFLLVLKKDFFSGNVNFIKKEKQGKKHGIGGIIRDSSKNVVWRFSGPVEALDANEVEMFALLVGSRPAGIT